MKMCCVSRSGYSSKTKKPMRFWYNEIAEQVSGPFADSNKRIGAHAMLVFLAINASSCFLHSNFCATWHLLTHNLTQNRKKSMETVERKGRESIWFWLEDVRKALEMSKPDFGAQLITRRLQVQVLSPQPKVLGFPLKSEDFPYFPELFRAVYFCGYFLTHILTHTGIRSVQGRRAPERTLPIVFAASRCAAVVTWA